MKGVSNHIEKVSIPLTETMLEFVRAAVFEREPVVPHNEEVDWDRLMDISKEQGLLAWVWDGISQLPTDQQPPRQQRISWGLSAHEIWDEYDKKSNVLDHMLQICGQNHMRLLLLKGIDVSQLYPKPQSRSAGDIDIYLFKDYKKGNKLFGDNGIEQDRKHATLSVGGVCVENHKDFLEPGTIQKIKIINYLNKSLNDVRHTSRGYYVLPPVSNLLFLCFHTLKHFFEGNNIPIRNIMDFAFFINHNREQLPPHQCGELMKEMQLEEGFELLVYLSEQILNIDIKDYHFTTLPQDYLDGLKEILLYGRFKDPASCPYWTDAEYSKYISRYVPRNFGVTYKNFLPIVGVRILRVLFIIPKGSSFKETMQTRLKGISKPFNH